MPVFTLNYFSADLFLRLVCDFTAEKKVKKDPFIISLLFLGQKCNPLRSVIGNAMYPDHEVLRKQNSFKYFVDF